MKIGIKVMFEILEDWRVWVLITTEGYGEGCVTTLLDVANST